MENYRYTLEEYNGLSSRHRCPNCNSRDKTFTRYIDNLTGKYIDPAVGRCNRENKCGYHYPPKEYFIDNDISYNPSISTRHEKPSLVAQKTISFFLKEEMINTLTKYENNNFVKFLLHHFGAKITSMLISKYYIGTSNQWEGATIFWQIDSSRIIRTGKIMLYNASDCKRVKEPYNHIGWVHSTLKTSDFALNQCLFGEHLIITDSKPIAIVESEKTAIIASVYLPQFIWLATGGLSNLSIERCKVLRGRKIILYPDLNSYDKWAAKAKELSSIANVVISDNLEQKATEAEKELGLDLADFLLRFSHSN